MTLCYPLKLNNNIISLQPSLKYQDIALEYKTEDLKELVTKSNQVKM